MDYNDGFRDALEIFENSINKAVTVEKDFTSAMNEIISTLYMARLRFDQMEDQLGEYLEDHYKEMSGYEGLDMFMSNIFDINCDACPLQEECEDKEEEF